MGDNLANLYCHPADANIRYRGRTSRYCDKDGWCYVFTKDNDHVQRLASNRTVQTRNEYDEWQAFRGEQLSDSDDNICEVAF